MAYNLQYTEPLVRELVAGNPPAEQGRAGDRSAITSSCGSTSTDRIPSGRGGGCARSGSATIEDRAARRRRTPGLTTTPRCCSPACSGPRQALQALDPPPGPGSRRAARGHGRRRLRRAVPAHAGRFRDRAQHADARRSPRGARGRAHADARDPARAASARQHAGRCVSAGSPTATTARWPRPSRRGPSITRRLAVRRSCARLRVAKAADELFSDHPARRFRRAVARAGVARLHDRRPDGPRSGDHLRRDLGGGAICRSAGPTSRTGATIVCAAATTRRCSATRSARTPSSSISCPRT